MIDPVSNILRRVLVNSFYRANAGFFLFWFFVLFGAVSGGQVISYHLSLIQGMIESAVFLGVVIGIWFLYTIKCINYTGRQCKEPRNHFLSVLNRLSQKQQFRQLLWVHVQIYTPVLVYAVIVAIIAGRQHFYGSMIAVITSNISMVMLSGLVYRNFLQKKPLPAGRYIPVIRYRFPKPLFSLPLWFVLSTRKQMLLVTKIFTVAILYLFMLMYEPEGNDIRAFLLILLLAGAGHSFVVFQMRSFEEEYLVFSRNLPVRNVQRFAGLLLLYGILLLPELFFVFRVFHAFLEPADYVQVLLYTIAFPVFLHSILLMEDMDTDSYLPVVFITAAALFFITLYDPGTLLPVAIIALSFVFFNAHFNTFEKRHT